MIDVPKQFQPKINVVYPPNNHCEFERWFFEDHLYTYREITREYLPVFWTGYYVNNNYGQDKSALHRLQEYLNSLDTSKKYFSIIQYDDAILNDVSHLDLYQFNMSKPYDYPLPLIGQPHPYVFNEPKKYLANFVGNITHPIREHAKTLKGKEGYYISFDRHEPEAYCRIIAQSHFTLCYRGYGLNSFRIAEALQYGSTPIYISDEFIQPHNISFEQYGIKVKAEELGKLEFKLRGTELKRRIYQEAYTYEGTKNKILNHLRNVD